MQISDGKLSFSLPQPFACFCRLFNVYFNKCRGRATPVIYRLISPLRVPPLRTPSGLRSYRGSGSEKPDLIDFHLCFFIDSDGTFLVSKRIDGQSVGTQDVNVLFTLVMLVCVCVIDWAQVFASNLIDISLIACLWLVKPCLSAAPSPLRFCYSMMSCS